MFSSMAMRQPSSLTSYDSAPGSLLTGLADSVISAAHGHGSNRGAGQEDSHSHSHNNNNNIGGLFIGNPHSVVNDASNSNSNSNSTSSASASALAAAAVVANEHDTSSPSAGFFSHLLLHHGAPVSREPQLRLSGSGSRSLSRIESGNMSDKADREHAGPSNYMGNGFTISPWDDHSDSINFATSPGKRGKGIDGDLLTAYTDMDSQASAELGQYEKFFQLQQDQVPFKVRAKRGCATHPRSIAERERRTRISDKLRKLQEVVPNMEKQTSTSDMLDLAVQHIKDLQTQLKVMSQERESCTCQNYKR